MRPQILLLVAGTNSQMLEQVFRRLLASLKDKIGFDRVVLKSLSGKEKEILRGS